MARLALVTGGIRGIGKGISVALKAAGYDVVAAYNANDQKAAQFTEETGIKCIKFDISDFEQCGIALEKIKQSMGEVSVLVNNAGITRDSAFRNSTLEDWQAVIDINLGGLFNMCRLVFPDMIKREYGRIVNVSSMNGLSGQYGQANYSASKAGIIGFTKTLALEGAKYGVTVNAIAPGYVSTEMFESVPDKIKEKILAKIPVGRVGTVEEVARGVVFLAAEDAGFITGSTLSINGGQYLQ
ncbi:MAG TPA: acetoacetyl-CoA reductase [Spongiibacteraceae bacterium]|nr:acetoacetyl-CoA reductase [Spongiibacteraceae bacterium]